MLWCIVIVVKHFEDLLTFIHIHICICTFWLFMKRLLVELQFGNIILLPGYTFWMKLGTPFFLVLGMKHRTFPCKARTLPLQSCAQPYKNILGEVVLFMCILISMCKLVKKKKILSNESYFYLLPFVLFILASEPWSYMCFPVRLISPCCDLPVTAVFCLCFSEPVVILWCCFLISQYFFLLSGAVL